MFLDFSVYMYFLIDRVLIDFAARRSPLQELDVGRQSGPYLLVWLKVPLSYINVWFFSLNRKVKFDVEPLKCMVHKDFIK